MSSLCDCQLTANPRVICEGHQIALQELLTQHNTETLNRGVDVLAQTALGIAGMGAVAVQDVPRLVVQVACRGVEKFIESYERRKASGTLSMEDEGQFKILIRNSAEDLLRALDEGRATITDILTTLDAQPGVSPQ